MTKSGIIISGDAGSVNFREVSMGNIAPNTLYRSSHPIMGDYMPLDDRNLRAIAEHYLITAIKLSAAEIELLKRKLAGNYRIIKGV